ncbi:DUF6479 family protein [Streptomyces sp. ME19-01-6]|uniref:DUF6479 family protein n=1 Tax=Streptomyces sp. ME19-01-6 TaxID=3028686 RepID=UPI0029A128AA|nr:DUF6479 family protein [Streptomyces sp. ME19-01-6]MDX3230760.1 DUF6479 family protein [Streptomyces sp. ME19-01-6]
MYAHNAARTAVYDAAHDAASNAGDLAVNRDLLVGTGPLVVGIVIVVLLIAAVWWGMRLRAREPAPPQGPQRRAGAWQAVGEPEGRARADGHGPGHQESARVGYVRENREPEELPRDGTRRLPHQLGGSGNEDSRRSADDGGARPTWNEGSGGSFGNG